ncbi:amino acid ABC transporter permease [Terrarubrum flagellatum]|uniref:amino acid ABC transporter permease n=1 Tax=Terrirubrum flagellatum TaxID=2895980 RepID=UPI003144D783
MNYTFQFGTIASYTPDFAAGAWLTLRLSTMALIFGMIIGCLCAVALTYGAKPIRWAALIYVEFIRNTPFLIQLYFVFFALPSFGLRLPPSSAALLAMSINFGAYATEIVRAGIEAVPYGQIEAGRSLGLRTSQIVRFIVMFPAIKAVYPALTSQFVLLLLGSSVVSAIAAEELTAIANNINSVTFRSFEIYLTATAIYVAMALGFKGLFGALHRIFLAPRG